MPNRLTAAVVALLLLLAVLILGPAIYMMRESEGRVRCTNNLKQIGIGLATYCNSEGAFPRGTVPNDAFPPERRLSWVLSVWPYLEARPRLLVKMASPWDDYDNRDLREVLEPPKHPDEKIVPLGQVRLFFCPRNPQRRKPDVPSLMHYVGIAGIGDDAATRSGPDPAIGVFGYDRSTEPNEIKDGLSSTLLLMETAQNNGPWTAGGPATVRSVSFGLEPYLGPGRPFGGTHSRCTLPLYADVSVRPLHDSVEPEVLRALATIAGGEDVRAYKPY